ncbi:MAG: hypothetical protein J7L54_01790 [Elusimicrobia bacterium]|nr:hypothetical protein [Elusimicrobiota bacterium]
MRRRQRHRIITGQVAGKKGKREVPISGGRRLDVRKGRRATEVERSGNPASIKKALNRLKTQKNFKKELLVPQKDLNKAKDIAQKLKVNVLIQNLSRTRRKIVRKK